MRWLCCLTAPILFVTSVTATGKLLFYYWAHTVSAKIMNGSCDDFVSSDFPSLIMNHFVMISGVSGPSHAPSVAILSKG